MAGVGAWATDNKPVSALREQVCRIVANDVRRHPVLPFGSREVDLWPPRRRPAHGALHEVAGSGVRLREAGDSDSDNAAIIEASLGKSISPDAITRFYAGPEERRRPE